MAWQDPHERPEWRDAYGSRHGQGPLPPNGPEPQDTPPPGYAQDPYGYGQNPYGYGQDPYAQDPYGPYGYGAHPPGVPVRRGTPGLTVAALVANIASALLCCVGLTWIPGIILAAMAMSRNNTDPELARKLTVGAWVCFAVDVVLTVAGLVVLGLIGDSHSTSTY